MRQFLRKARVTFTGAGGGFIVNPGNVVRTHELRVAFKVSKGVSGSANTAELSVWNLAEGHRNAVGKEFDKVTLECGYSPPDGGDNIGLIAVGEIRDVLHERDGPDIVTTVQFADGDKALRKATVSKTHPAGTPVKDVVDNLATELEKFGVERGEIKLPDNVPDYRRPYSIVGSAARELDVVGRSRGFYWSIQNNAFEVCPADGFLPGVVLITPETGMIDAPTITDNGVKVSCLLNPEIRPNRTVQIESQMLEMNGEGGLYRVSQVGFNGDNTEGDFRAEVHGEAIKGGKVDEGVK